MIPVSIRTFKVVREEDVSGVSGIGIVAQGVEWFDGEITMKWISNLPSITLFKNRKHLESIHGHGGKTNIVWDDEVNQKK